MSVIGILSCVIEDQIIVENVKIMLRDGYNPNPEPLIVINGYVAENKDILRKFRLVEKDILLEFYFGSKFQLIVVANGFYFKNTQLSFTIYL